MESVQLPLVLAAAKGWDVHHNVKSTFLNDDLAEMVFVKQTSGIVIPGVEHKVLQLHKALYRLWQEPRVWNVKLDATPRALGFARGETEHAIYVRRQGKFELIIRLYVDDLIVMGTSTTDIASFKREMEDQFRIRNLGVVSYYLGIEVKRVSSEMQLG
jgi:hypothetical protein